MKSKYFTVLYLIISLHLGLLMISCEQIEEVPPRSETSSGDSYKMPDPVILNIQEVELVDSIKNEYKTSTSGTSQSELPNEE